MIYICEYNRTIDKQRLLDAAAHLPIASEVKPMTEDQKEDRAEKMAQIRWEKRRERILAWMLLKYAVRSECEYTLGELQIGRTEKGKPYSSSHPEIQFNLSHCGTACACIVGSAECGIDIERKFPYRESLAKRICHEEEWKLLQNLFADIGDAESLGRRRMELRERQLQILWSLKESYVKRNGRGLGYGMERINFAELMPFGRTGISVEQSVLWDWEESYTMAASIGRRAFAAGLLSGGELTIRRISERELFYAER